MKQLAYILAATAVIAGCAEQDKIHADYENIVKDEITFSLVPVVDGSDSEFAATSIFQAGAYYNAPGCDWTSSSLESNEYFPETSAANSGDLWHLEQTYCWPSDNGSLTFFGWSLNRDDLSFNPESQTVAGIDRERGVYLESFDISLDPDADFMVADASSDKVLTRSSASVPTVFSSQLSRVELLARTKGDYSASKEIRINSVKLTNMAKTADFQQGECKDGVWSEVDKWTVRSTYDATYGDYTSSPVLITAEESALPGGYQLYIPQTLAEDEQMLEVSYTIKDIITGFTENVTETLSLRSLVPEGELRAGAQHSISFYIYLEEIYWAPEIVGWETGKVTA